jgi:FkbM family methyltransferase
MKKQAGPIEIRYSEKYRLWYREGVNDMTEIPHVKDYDALNIQPGDTVLDLGAHIGSFAVRACDKFKAGKVISLEPAAFNFEILEMNAASRPIIPIKAAVTSDPEKLRLGEAKFWLYRGWASGANSLRQRRGRTEFEMVPVVSLHSLIEEYSPRVVKIDIEEEEYNLDVSAFFYVEAVAMEIHLIRREYRNVHGPALYQKFIDAGFRSIKKPNWNHPWGADVVFVRS